MREGSHRLVRLRGAGRGESARLLLPEGGGIELSREKWLRLAQVVGQMFGTGAPPSRPARPRPVNAGRRWTGALDAELALHWRRGETEVVLARRFGRTRHAVQMRLKALQLVHPMTGRPLAQRAGIGQELDLAATSQGPGGPAARV